MVQILLWMNKLSTVLLIGGCQSSTLSEILSGNSFPGETFSASESLEKQLNLTSYETIFKIIFVTYKTAKKNVFSSISVGGKELKLKIPSDMNNSEYISRSKVEWNSCGLSHDPSDGDITNCWLRREKLRKKWLVTEKLKQKKNVPDVKKSVSAERKFFFVFYFKINQQLFEIVSSFRREQFRCSAATETTFFCYKSDY